MKVRESWNMKEKEEKKGDREKNRTVGRQREVGDPLVEVFIRFVVLDVDRVVLHELVVHRGLRGRGRGFEEGAEAAVFGRGWVFFEEERGKEKVSFFFLSFVLFSLSLSCSFLAFSKTPPKKVPHPSRGPLSVQLVPSTNSFSRFRNFDTDLRAWTWHPTPIKSKLLISGPRASTVASTDRLGDSDGFTPREARISSLVRATTGKGARRSLGSLWTQTTASTALVSSIATAIEVTTPVHWAPSTGGTARA